MRFRHQSQFIRGSGKGIQVAHPGCHVAPYAVVAVYFLWQEGVAGGVFWAALRVGCGGGGLDAAGRRGGGDEEGRGSLDCAGGAGEGF
jgi:hypothetical protein